MMEPEISVASFNPGPSEPYAQIAHWMRQVAQAGWLAEPHRSPRFKALYAETELLLRDKLNIPEDYSLGFLPSASAAWQLCADAAQHGASLHLHSGSFGEKWAQLGNFSIKDRSVAISPEADWRRVAFPGNFEFVALTANETSNASRLPTEFYGRARQQFPTGIIAVDATSSLAGEALPIRLADIWFASVQKCFGMPAGLAIVWFNTLAAEWLQAQPHTGRLNSPGHWASLALRRQTTHTPSVLHIALLNRVALHIPNITHTEQSLRSRANRLRLALGGAGWRPLIQNAENQSITVIGAEAAPEAIKHVRENALAAGMYIGKGYGPWQETSFRIANFPAIAEAAWEKLLNFVAQTGA